MRLHHFPGASSSPTFGKSGMGAGPGFPGATSSAPFVKPGMGAGSGFSGVQTPLKGTAGSGFTQLSKEGGSFRSFASSYGSGQPGEGRGGDEPLRKWGNPSTGGGLSSVVSSNPTAYPPPFGKGGYRTTPSKGNRSLKSFGKTPFRGKNDQ